MPTHSEVEEKQGEQAPRNPKKAHPTRSGLGQWLHWISRCKYIFWVLGMCFQARAMFFTQGSAMLDALSTTLLMYGIAMSFESLRDNEVVSERQKRAIRERPRTSQGVIAAVFAGGLFSMAVGIVQFFLIKNRDLAWAITTFGLGMVALGRQQYDQHVSVLKFRDDVNARSANDRAV